MKLKILDKSLDQPLDLHSVVESIASTQRETGEIPWCNGDKTDPWDMVESAMGLSIGGKINLARKAFAWLEKEQLSDGSWYASYINGKPEDKTHDANMTSYIAVGLYHHYLITKDERYLHQMWPVVEKAINFALSLQAPGGEIYWAKSPEGIVDHTALMTGSSSIYMSVKCAVEIAKILEKDTEKWQNANKKILDAVQNRPHSFNIAKSRFSMDWFYPVLSGALTGEMAQKRIDKYWKKFVVEGQGIRCVSDEPWVTIAETCEFILALSAMGNDELAGIFFNWIQGRRFDDGSYWCGYTFPDMIIWPEDKLTWTNAVVLMAADALFGLTPAGSLFKHSFWKEK